MCFSALVKQNLKQLSLQFRARVDDAAFEDLFRRRLDGEDLKICKALEYNFRKNPKTPEEKKIAKLIEKWIDQENNKDRARIKKEETRLADAIEKLKVKETKKAQNDKRVAANWIEKCNHWIERRSRLEPQESDGIIWPFWYFPMVYFNGKENVIAPFRYHMRPEGKPESFDQQFEGNYNARENRLHDKRPSRLESDEKRKQPAVAYWEKTYGKKHGIMVIERFYENVSESRFKHNLIKVGQPDRNVVVSFDPGKSREMLVPMLYNNWKAPGKPPINGAAAITFDPPEEVSAAGHDRCVGRLRPENAEIFLHPEKHSIEDEDRVIDDHEQYHFKAALAA